jgi:hypothetical protein
MENSCLAVILILSANLLFCSNFLLFKLYHWISTLNLIAIGKILKVMTYNKKNTHFGGS